MKKKTSEPSYSIENEYQKKVFQDYLEGMTLIAISRKYGISESTIYKWSQKGKWQELRRRFKQDLEKSLINKLINKITENTEQHVDISRVASKIALETLMEAYRTRSADRLDVAERTARIGNMTASIQKTVMPSANEEVLNQALEELEKIKRSWQPKFDFDNEESPDG